ncbi:MAG: ABC transporter permease [Acidobacteriia bacterium]|nr:ABC transporter permease [Terriglobia bacterium]MBV8905138.1 ABC transporter permease [Terriglobia bacterium]
MIDDRPLKVIRPPSLSLSVVAAGVKNLVQYAGLLYTFTCLRLGVRYRQSFLGWLWALLQPLALLISYTVIFSRVAKLPSEGVPYPAFVLCALVPWGFFSSAIAAASPSLVHYQDLVMKVYFPREIIPLSYISASAVDLGIAMVLLLGVMASYGMAVTWNLVYLIPILVILAAFSAAVALLLSAVQVRWRDIGIAVPLLLQVWLWATPVVYPIASIPAAGRRLYVLNPLAVLIDSFRQVTLHGHSPDGRLLTLAGAISLFSLLVSYAAFKNVEATMADFI